MSRLEFVLKTPWLKPRGFNRLEDLLTVDPGEVLKLVEFRAFDDKKLSKHLRRKTDNVSERASILGRVKWVHEREGLMAALREAKRCGVDNPKRFTALHEFDSQIREAVEGRSFFQ